MVDNNTLSPGSIILDEYIIEKGLGEGGMGKVYLVSSQITGARFAVKCAKIVKDFDRKNFITELQAWIGLHEHPNLTACNFFRVIGAEVLIFAEYIDGGNLQDWISDRRLYAGGAEIALERILNIATQFARGLQSIHEQNLIHQDIKPSNVLMTEVGIPKITDFGLARTRFCATDRSLVSTGVLLGKESILVSSGGMTPAYASPEQCAGESLSRKTDIWSWGVSVLDMFIGDVSCPYGGNIAAEVLRHYLEKEQKEKSLPVMPQQVADVLIKCFERDFSRRWGSLKEVVEILSKFTNTPLGHASRWNQPLQLSEDGVLMDLDIAGSKWQSPGCWINIAIKLGAVDLPEYKEHTSLRQGSRKVQIVEDFGAYRQIESSLRKLIMQGKTEASGVLGQLCGDMAHILKSAGDLAGAAQLQTEAISLMEEAVSSHPDKKILAFLPMAYMNQAVILSQIGRHKDAIVALDRGIARANVLAAEKWWWHFDDLAGLYFNKANRLRSLGELQSAVENYDKALQTLVDFEQLVTLMKDEFRIPIEEKSQHLLALIHTNKAIVLRSRGDVSGAVKLYDKALDMLAGS